MTRHLYESVLRFYPAAYRETFGREMIETYERAAAESGDLLFSIREIGGLVAGIVSEWMAKWVAPDTYLTARSRASTPADLPPQIVEARAEIDRLIRSMEFAIAHHDFPKARFYSEEERAARRKLEHLIGKYGLSPDTVAV